MSVEIPRTDNGILMLAVVSCRFHENVFNLSGKSAVLKRFESCLDLVQGRSLKLPESEGSSSYTVLHHRSKQSLKTSVPVGCHLCNLIVIQFSDSRSSSQDALDRDYSIMCQLNSFTSKHMALREIWASEARLTSREVSRSATFDVIPTEGSSTAYSVV